MDDERIDTPPPPPRSLTTDQRVAVYVFIIFVLLLIVFPLLISMGKRNQGKLYEQYRSGTTQLKFD